MAMGGLILSTPFTVILVVLGRHVEHLEFLDVLLGDRPALTPVENIYQRILAGDPDEARDHAEKLLKDRPLIAYYDDVAVEGLRLAANDARRGVLGEDKLATIQNSTRDLLEDLSNHEDRRPEPPVVKGAADMPSIAEQDLPGPDVGLERVAPEALAPAWRGEAPVLCIAGRGPFDDAAATILAQLLAKHGLGARAIPHEGVSRRDIEQLDLTGVVIVCLVYLTIERSPSHLRYLLQRLRERLPAGKLMVGLWRPAEPTLIDLELQQALGADVLVTSMRQAVEACLAESKCEPIKQEAMAIV